MQLKVYEITWGETQTATGTIAGNVVSYDVAFSDQGPVGPVGSQGIQGPPGLPGDFVVNFRVVSAAETLVSKAKIAANTTAGAFTLTLPANPTNGDVIDFYDYAETFDTNPLTLNRNGQRIEGQEDNLICNVEGAYFSLVYSGSARGWQVLPSFGTSGGGGESVLTTTGDLLYRGSAVGERLPVGSQGQVLKVNNGLPAWGNETMVSVSGRAGVVVLTKSDVGLGNVDNTADLNKPISTATQTALDGKQASGSYAAASHAHAASDITSGTLDIARIPTGTSSTSVCIGNDTRLSDSRSPSQHSSTHHTGGTDAIAPNNIGAAWSLVVSSQFISSNTLLSAGRNRRITFSAVNQTVNVDLPYSGNADGDVVTLVASSGLFTGSTLSIRTATGVSGGLPVTYATLATLTAPNQSFTFVSNGTATGWTLRAVDTHTHGNLSSTGTLGSTSGLPVVTTTSGAITTLALGAANTVLKVNSGGTAVEFGEGGGVDDYTVITSSQTATNGARIAADTTAGAFTLTLPASPSNGDTVSVLDYAGTFDTNNLTIARNGSNIESLAENMDCNLEDAAFSLVYVGAVVGWKVVPYFGAKTNLASAGPIGSTIPSTGAFTTLTATTLQNTPVGNTGASTGAFTTLSATSTITGQLGATVGSTSAAAIAVGHANSGIYVNSNQIVFTKQGVECMFFDNSSRVNINTTGGLQIVQTDAPIIFSRAISLFPDATSGALAQRSGTQAQEYRIYNTFSSATNNERGLLGWRTNVFAIGTEKGSGGGTARGMELRTDNVARINISATGGIGFFGAAAAAQPTAVADATDAASVITQINALLSRMRTLGLIAT